MRDVQARDVLPAQRAGFTGCLLPAPETWHHLLEKEPPSSWSFPLPHPWKPMATKLSAAPRDTSPGRESVLSWTSCALWRGGHTDPPSQPRDTRRKELGSDTRGGG